MGEKSEGGSEWKSQISIFNPKDKVVEKEKGKEHFKLMKIPMNRNEVCTAMSHIVIKDQQGKEWDFLVAACCQNLSYSPKLNYDRPCIKVYEKVENTYKHYHTT